MALIASKSNAFVDPNSRLQLKTCVEYLWLPTFIVWLLNLFCLLLHYRINRYRAIRTLPKDIVVVEQSHEEEQQPPPPSSLFVTMTTAKLPRFTERFRLRQLGETSKQAPLMIDRSISVPTLLSLNQSIDESEASFQPSQSRSFKIILFTLLIIVIALLFASNDKVNFDIGIFERFVIFYFFFF